MKNSFNIFASFNSFNFSGSFNSLKKRTFALKIIKP